MRSDKLVGPGSAMSGSFGASRFGIFRRQVDGLAQKTLTQCLRRLERNGIIERRLIVGAPPGVEYRVTDLAVRSTNHLVR